MNFHPFSADLPVSADLLAQEIDQLNRQAKTLVSTAPKEAEQLATHAYALAQSGPFAETSYQRGMAESDSIRCFCYILYSDCLQAITYGERALALSEACSLPYLIAETSDYLGHAYTRLGQYVEGLRYQLQQEQLAIQHGFRNLEAAAYLGRAAVYSYIGDRPKAIELEKAALAIFREMGDRRGVLVACNNLGFSYGECGEYAQALHYGLDALPSDDEPNLQDLALVACTNIGRAYRELGDFPKALFYLEKSLRVAEATGMAYIKLLTHLELGRLAQAQRDSVQALAYLTMALQEATVQEEKRYQYEAHYVLAEVYDQLNEPKTALAHFRAFHAVRDDLLNLQNQARLGVLDVEYAVASAQRDVERANQVAVELEQQVHARTADLQAALMREQELSRQLEMALSRESELQQLKSQIIHTASHEFRTPLAIIELSAGLLFKQYEQLAPDKRLKYWQRVQEQILYLKDMLQDIFTVNSATDVTPHYTTAPFADFAQRLHNALVDAIAQTQLVHFTFAASTQPVTTDFDLIKRILFNLVVNAIKFSDAAAPVEVTCTHSAHDLHLQVIDQGIGIPTEEIGRIFDLFYRGSNVDTRRGIGLGLSVVQKLVGVLQGTVRAESPGLNQGSTFTVLIPLLPAP